MQPAPEKILAIQLRSLGDAVLLIPSLMAIRDRFPGCELHVLVHEAAMPLLRHHPAVNRVWGFQRKRKGRFAKTWPVLRALRAERFDRSVDFSGNDRSAIASIFAGARERLGLLQSGGFLGRRLCYTQLIPMAPFDRHETLRSLHVLSGWEISPPGKIAIQLHTDPTVDSTPSERQIICHVGAGMPKKEWPVEHWAELHRLATAAGYRMVFMRAADAREQALIQKLQTLAPDATVLPALDLARLLGVLKSAGAVISSDTGPMHMAAALGVPTVAMFGPSSLRQWAPIGPNCRAIQAPGCSCDGASHTCRSAKHCMSNITPAQVLRELQALTPVEIVRS
ncbi:MAG TPA: glycosyltransferase family 9 protein [Candidatus Paceibacterota bacterium]|nr:glycosyltransferase family 9 protein [Candidatus Paceibacterota bacterium]